MTLDRAYALALVVSGAVGGVVLAVVGAFLIPLAYGPLSVGDAVALLTVGPFCHFVGRAARNTWVGTLPGVAWLFATMMLATRTAEGDLIVTGEAFGMAFLLLGTVSAALGIGTIRAGISRDDARREARLVSPNGSSESEFGR